MLFQPNKSYFLLFRVRFIALLVTVSITVMDDLLFYISCTSMPLKSIFVFTACLLSPPWFRAPPPADAQGVTLYAQGAWGTLRFRDEKQAEDGCFFGLSLTSMRNEVNCHIYDSGLVNNILAFACGNAFTPHHVASTSFFFQVVVFTEA